MYSPAFTPTSSSLCFLKPVDGISKLMKVDLERGVRIGLHSMRCSSCYTASWRTLTSSIGS